MKNFLFLVNQYMLILNETLLYCLLFLKIAKNNQSLLENGEYASFLGKYCVSIGIYP